MKPRFQQGLSSRFQDFMKPGYQELLRSGVLDLWSSRVQELMISGHQRFLTSGDQDAKTSIRIDFLTSLFHDGLSSRFIHPISRQFCSDVGFGNGWFASSDWPASKRERNVIFDPFLSPRNIICSGLSKLCFPLREIDFVTENSLPARGRKTPPKSSFFTGYPVCQNRFSSDLKFSLASLEISSAKTGF